MEEPWSGAVKLVDYSIVDIFEPALVNLLLHLREAGGLVEGERDMEVVIDLDVVIPLGLHLHQVSFPRERVEVSRLYNHHVVLDVLGEEVDCFNTKALELGGDVQTVDFEFVIVVHP